jgi:hypothetical protein
VPETAYPMKKFPIASHHEVKETFADQLGSTLLDASTMRIEFLVARMEGEAKPSLPPKGERHVVCRLVLTHTCAVDLINQMSQVAAQLVQAGIIKTDAGKASAPTTITGARQSS